MSEKQNRDLEAQSTEVNQLKRMMTQKEDGTIQTLIKFQEQLVQKDKEISEIQNCAKKKQLELETLLKREKKKYADQSTKLNSKLNKQESLVAKYFGVEQELKNLRSSVLLKDKEIARLNDQL